MENDFMNELEDFIAGTATGGSPAASNMASAASVPTSKSAKDVLGERIIAKRKLEDQGNNDIMSKTQKMDLDHNLASESIDNGLGGHPGGVPGGMNNTPGGPQRLLEQALMQKQMGPGSSPATSGIKSPQNPGDILLNKKEQRNEELTALLSEHPHLVANFKQKMQNIPPNNVINRQNSNMGGMGQNPDNSGNFYGLQQGPVPQQQQIHPQQPQRLPMQPQQRPHNWNNGMMYNGKMNMRPQGPRSGPGGGFYGDPNNGGPPPNAWVQPNGPGPGGQITGPPGPVGNPAAYYNRNGQRGPPGGMMRPNMGPGGDFNGTMYPGNPGQPHPGMRNYGPINNTNDPYTVNRFPNGGNPGGPGGPGPVGPGGVCQQPMYSPNNPTGDSMHALRMSATNFPDSNVGYNGYGNPAGGPPPQPGGPEFNGPPQQPPNGYNRMRPNFNNPNMMPNMMHGPRVTNMPPVGPNGPMGNQGPNGPMGPSGQMCHNGNMVEMQQPFNQPQQQQQPPQQSQGPMTPSNGGFMDQNNGGPGFNNNNAVLNNNENFNEFNPMMQNQPGQPGQPGQHMDHPDQSWRSRATDIRQTLLNKLKEALTSQNYPNALEMATSYENEAFISANNVKEYQFKLVQWLASIYDSSSSNSLGGGLNLNPAPMMGPGGGMGAGMDTISSPPDSSTNGLTDVSSTSPKVHDQSCNDLVESTGGNGPASNTTPGAAGTKTVTADDLMLATPKSESCLSPTSSPGTSAVQSPLATTISTPAASSVASASTTLTKASSPLASGTSSSTTFQCPPPAMPPIESIGPMGGGVPLEGSKTNVVSSQQRTSIPVSQQSTQPPPNNGTQRGKLFSSSFYF